MDIITTPRLILRATVKSDVGPLHKFVLSDPAVMQYAFGGQLLTRKQSQSFILREFNFMGRNVGISTLIERKTNRVIGFSGLHECHPLGSNDLELGFILAQSAWGQGYATEIGHAQIRHGFETVSRQRLLALVDPDNAASIRVLQKIGMTYWQDTTVEDRGLRHIFGIEQTSYVHRDSIIGVNLENDSN